MQAVRGTSDLGLGTNNTLILIIFWGDIVSMEWAQYHEKNPS